MTRPTLLLVVAGAAMLCGTFVPVAAASASAGSIEASTNIALSGLSAALADPFVVQAEISGNGLKYFGAGEHGVALSADGNTALITEWEETGQADVFTRSGSTWSLQARLPQPSGITGRIGHSVALAADGNTALLTSWNGKAWTYTRSGSTWTFQSELAPREGEGVRPPRAFAYSTALSSDGNTAILGAVSANASGVASGAAWVFTRSGSTWSEETVLNPADQTVYPQGEGASPDAVALSADGGVALLGNPADGESTGGAWIYERTAAGWVEHGSKLTGQGETGLGEFGSSVALSGDGSTALIGGPYDAYGGGGAWAFARGEGGWKPQGDELIPKLEPVSGGFGESLALSANGATALIGGGYNGPEREGAAWVFRRSGEHWWQEQKLADPVPHPEAGMGGSVALSGDATTALVSAPSDP